MALYLVTGAAGFIASRVAEQLLAQGHSVVGVDNLNDYYDVRLKDYRLARLLGEAANWQPGGDTRRSQFAGHSRHATGDGRFLFEAVDLENLAELERLFQEFPFDAVFNLAARAGVGYSVENPHVYLTTNAHGTLNLLECQRKFGVKKMVLASTSSLYAGSPLPFTEDQPVNTPLSPYAASKKAAELLAYSHHKMHGLDITVLRYFTVFGPAGRPDMSLFRFIRWIEAGQPLKLFGDGKQSRDFTFVDDIARGTVLAVKPVGYEIVNLGGGRSPTSLTEVIAKIETALGKKARVEGLPPLAADIKSTRADIAKAARLLGWQPETAFDDGLAATIAWHRANQGWLTDIRV
ncbi:MAG TPA: NAD-dependent epimerase/dehydratase family protein [Opitutales bacterium]|nr:NAD-dependent epimerase/dehydratase family protein [Opitutales bacterium]